MKMTPSKEEHELMLQNADLRVQFADARREVERLTTALDKTEKELFGLMRERDDWMVKAGALASFDDADPGMKECEHSVRRRHCPLCLPSDDADKAGAK